MIYLPNNRKKLRDEYDELEFRTIIYNEYMDVQLIISVDDGIFVGEIKTKIYKL